MFIKENCIESRGTSDHWVYKYEFSERLNNWLNQNHFPKMTKAQLNEYMRDNYNESNRTAPDITKTYRVWVGIKWGRDTNNLNQFNHFTYLSNKVYIYREKYL